MAKILTVDEMLDALRWRVPEKHRLLVVAVEAVGNLVADTLASEFKVKVGPVESAGVLLAGTAAAVMPGHPGQECPAEIAAFDPEEPFA